MNRGVEESVYRRWAPLGKRALRKLMIIRVLLLATVFIGQWYRLRYEDTYTNCAAKVRECTGLESPCYPKHFYFIFRIALV